MFLSLLLVAVVVLVPCQCQDLHKVLRKWKELPAKEALMQDPNIIDSIHQATEKLNHLWTTSLDELAASNDTVSQECVDSIESIFFHNLMDVIPLLDATGKLAAGFMEGNLNFEAAFDECFDYNYTAFCGGQVNITFLPGATWNMGMCVPKYCTSIDVGMVLNSTDIFSVDQDSFYCANSKQEDFTAGAIVMIIVCSLFGCMVLIGTLFDKIVECVTSIDAEIHVHESHTSTQPAIGSSALTASDEKTALVPRVAVVRPSKSKVKWHDFITAFSLYKTVPTLLATKQTAGVITCLNGMRVISMFWVILGHTFALNIAGVDNPVRVLEEAHDFTFQAIQNAVFSVDSFFFLSGTLVAYLTLRQIKKTGRFPAIHYYIHRYLRLTPTYAFVLFFSWFVASYTVPGPIFSLTNPFFDACSKYWWTNLIYINNLYPWKLQEGCMAWGWYLANDMQFYIIAPLIIVPFYYLLPLGLTVAGVLLTCSFSVTATLSAVYDFQASELAESSYGYKTNVTQQSSDFIYGKPWGRVAPYIVGLLLGCMLYKEVRFPFSRLKNTPFYLALWVVSGLILVPCLYGLYFTFHGHTPSPAENIIYFTFARCAWGVGLALIVFACHNGYGGLINTFLSLKIWTPLSRLTFNAYLVHPVVLTVIYVQQQKTIHYTDVTVSVYVIGFVVVSYAIAALVCVCVEFPLGTIEMLVFRLVGLNGRSSQRQGKGPGKESEPVDLEQKIVLPK